MEYEAFNRPVVDDEKLNLDFALNKPSSVFERLETDPTKAPEVRETHEAVLLRSEGFIGAGNDGWVVEVVTTTGPSKLCLKMSWETLSVEVRGKAYYLLTPELKAMRKIQDYFEEVSAQKRLFVSRGVNFIETNSLVDEAGFQIIARKILEDAGFGYMVPDVRCMKHCEWSEDGELGEQVPYDYCEKVDVLVMEKIPGKSVQDLILSEDGDAILSTLDIDAIEVDLKKAFNILHDKELFHQDVTNRNIMIDFESKKPIIIDFGKARYRTQDFTRDEELEHVAAVVSWLRKAKANHKETRMKLAAQLKLVK